MMKNNIDYSWLEARRKQTRMFVTEYGRTAALLHYLRWVTYHCAFSWMTSQDMQA